MPNLPNKSKNTRFRFRVFIVLGIYNLVGMPALWLRWALTFYYDKDAQWDWGASFGIYDVKSLSIISRNLWRLNSETKVELSIIIRTIHHVRANKPTGGIKKCWRVQDDWTSVENFGFLTLNLL